MFDVPINLPEGLELTTAYLTSTQLLSSPLFLQAVAFITITLPPPPTSTADSPSTRLQHPQRS